MAKFYSISQHFKDTHCCLLYDQRGHGQSFHKKPYTIKQLALDLKNLLDHIKWNKVTLVGHSLGAYVSVFFASKYPRYVTKSIIVDASPWPSHQEGGKITKIISSLPDSFSSRMEAKDFFREKTHVFSSALANFLMASLEQKSNEPIQFVFDKKGLLELLINVREYDFPSLIKSLKCPTLVLRGEYSTHFLPGDFKKTLDINPLITGKEIKNAGHWLHHEQPQMFITTVKKILT